MVDLPQRGGDGHATVTLGDGEGLYVLSRRRRTQSFVFLTVVALGFQVASAPPPARASIRTVLSAGHSRVVGNAKPANDVDPNTGLKPGATELVSARTEYSQTYDNHDGTRTTQFFNDPVFYRPTGSTTLQPVAVGFAATRDGWASSKAPASVSVASATLGHDFLSTTYNGVTIGFATTAASQLNAAPIWPVVSGSAADYSNLMPGVDLRVFANADGAKSFFVWTALPASPAISYVADAPGLTLTPQADGSIAFADATGATVARMPKPYAVDSTADPLTGSGHTTADVSLSLGADGKTITVSVDPTWLKTAVYPVYVDPSTGWIYNAGSSSYGDAFVDSHSGSGYDDYVDATTGYHELWNGTSPADGGVTYDFLRWDLSAYANVTVDSATFRLYPWHQYYNAPTTETTYVRRLTSSWTEAGVTWANKPSYTTTNTATTGCVEGSLCNFDVSDIVQLWLQGISPSSNYGFQVDTIGKNSTYWKRFFSSEQGGTNRPALSITYHNAVTNALYPTGGGPTSDTTVSWSYSDSGSAPQTKFHVDVATDSAFATIVATSGDVSSAARNWAVGTALTPGTTYYWRVKGYNGTSWSGFSPTASFTYDFASLGLQEQFKTEDFPLGGGDQTSVNVVTGNLVVSHDIARLPIRGSSAAVALTYNSQDPSTTDLGPGWRLNVERRLKLNADGSVTFIDADGARLTFTSPVVNGTVTTYTRPAALFANLKKDTSQQVEFTLTYRDLSRDTFDIAGSEGLLTRAEDRYGNGVTLAYVSGTNRITTITDTAGARTISFGYDASNRISTITDWAYVDGSGVVQTTNSGSHRATRFFFDASGNLAGWADPRNTAGSCPTGGSHLTCLTYGSTLAIAKTQTYESNMPNVTLTQSTRAISTQIGLVGAEVAWVKDAEQVAASGPSTTFIRAAGQMAVVRPGTPASTTTYGYVASTDPYARVQSVWRLIGSTNIEDRTVFDAAFPTLAASETQNYGALLSTPARTVMTTYVAGSLGLVARTVEPLTASPATNRQTDFTYNANNDLVQQIVSQDGSASLAITTRYCYDAVASCSLTATGLSLLGQIENYVAAGSQNADTNVKTEYSVDAYGQRLTETRHNRDASGAVRDDRITAWSYDSLGNQLTEVVNYADGVVSSPGSDITPSATTGARTDLTSAFSYDTAGNRVSTADPRRAIEAAKGTVLAADDFISRATYDALGNAITQTLPTTPGQALCVPDPMCRRTTVKYDEFGDAIETTGYDASPAASLQTGTQFDRVGRAVVTYEQADGMGSARITSTTTLDAAGRVVDSKDELQVGDSTAGSTHTVYDALGEVTDLTTAYGSVPDASSQTHSVFDALGRQTQAVVGSNGGLPQTTTFALDLGGRSTSVNDGFTCQTSTFDYRDNVTSTTDGLNGTGCTTVSGQTRTLTESLDGLGRRYREEITSGPATGDRPHDDTFDAVGNTLSSGVRTSGVTSATTFTVDLLDQVTAEAHPDGSVTKTNFDPAGNATDRCVWTSAPTDPCLPAGSAFGSPQPVSVTSTGYDSRNQRISLSIGAGSAITSTTTYGSAVGYQVTATYLPTGAGRESQVLFSYDSRQRLATVTNQLCVLSSGHACSSVTPMGSDSYAYDNSNNKTQVVESNGVASSDRRYCYDAGNRLVYRNTGSPCSSAANDESNAFDATGNRTSTVAGGVTTAFLYNTAGQLCSVGGSSCTSPASKSLTYDSDGRTATWNGWAFLYDGDARLTSACQSASCNGTGFNRVDFTYDGDGHRTQIVETTAAGAVTTTTFTYQGDTVVSETVSTGERRTFVTDDTGRIIRMTVSGDVDPDDNATFVVAWNGHGDALGLWRQNADGSVTLANSFVYSTWGTPSTTIAAPFSDLAFRYLYVGAADVQWDNAFGLGLLYMHARHYAPALGRFLQPDGQRAAGAMYVYGGNSPATYTDPSGNCLAPAFAIPWIGWAVGAVTCSPLAVAAVITFFTFVVVDIHGDTVAQQEASQASIASNALQGAWAEILAAWFIWQLFGPGHIRFHVYFWTPLGARYEDICYYRSATDPSTRALFCIEVKSGTSYYGWLQRAKDTYITYHYGVPVILVRL